MTLVYLSAAWMAGIALADALAIPWQALLLTFLVGLIGLVGWKGSRRARLFCGCLVFTALGAGRLMLALPHFDRQSLATYNDAGRVTLEGVVVGEPDRREAFTNLRLEAETLLLPDGRELAVEGLALVKVARYPEFAYGDRLRVAGLLETPPEWRDFSYRDYLARQGIHSLLRDGAAVRLAEDEANALYAGLLAFKQRARVVIETTLHEPAASLLMGILLGIESGIPTSVMEDFSATGTTHIIAISGFNITIISGIFAGLSRRLVSRRYATWVAIGGVIVYTFFVGAAAAVVRAAIMGALYLLGKHLGRATFAPTSLSAAAILMTGINPYTLWDVGFQLSLAATAGLILYTEPLERGAVRLLSRTLAPEQAGRVVGWISEALLVTVAAQITTTPLLVAYFRRLSLVTLLTNVLILPVQPAVMIYGGLATLAGLAWLPLGRLLGWAAWLFLAYTIETVQLTARVPYAWVDLGRVEGWMVGGMYGLIGLVTWWGYLDEGRRAELAARARTLWSNLTARLSDRFLLGGSAIVLILAVVAWRSLPDGRLHVAFLDVGQGDAILIETPSGRQLLVDGGPSPSVLLTHLGRRMPFYDRDLDLLVLTHPDDDVLAGALSVLERYRVDAVVARDTGCGGPLCRRWQTAVERSQATVYRGEAGLRINLDEGLLLSVLHPGPESVRNTGADVNNNALVLRLDYGSVCILLASDIQAEAEARLVARDAWLDCTVLKVAHHGDGDSSTVPFLEAVDPEVAVIPVGAENRFRHPHWAVLERLGDTQVYRTDRDGTVEVVSDGVRYWIEREG